MIYSGHVKWFVPFEELTEGKMIDFSFTDPAVQVGVGAILAILLIAFWLDKKTKTPNWLKVFADRYEKLILKIFQIMVGLFLLITAYESMLFAPIFAVATLAEKALSAITVLAGLMMIFNYRIWISAVLLVFVYASAMFFYGFTAMIEHFHLIGIALFMFLYDFPYRKFKFIEKIRLRGVDILRISTGIALIILAWQEKLSFPILSEEFLSLHHWNFMKDFFHLSAFSDRYFALAGGFTELLFGLLFVAGWVTRINTLATSFFFISTAIILGPHEVLGHMPIFAIVIIFLVWGRSKKTTLN